MAEALASDDEAPLPVVGDKRARDGAGAGPTPQIRGQRTEGGARAATAPHGAAWHDPAVPGAVPPCEDFMREALQHVDQSAREGGGAAAGDKAARVRGGAMSSAARGGRTAVVQKRATDTEWEDALIVLDPQTKTSKLAAALASGKGWRQLLERPGSTWAKPCYQLMTLSGLLTADQRWHSKRITSQRI